MPKVRFAQLSDRGRVREVNEDRLGVYEPVQSAEEYARGWLFCLADGLGGHEGGEVASRLAVETVLAGFRRSLVDEPLGPLLTRVLRHTNEVVYDAAKRSGDAVKKGSGDAASGIGRVTKNNAEAPVTCSEPFETGRAGMATTFVACAIRQDQAVVAHVGDSRCYLFRDETLSALTRDHTVQNERQSLSSSSAAGDSEQRHVLTRALGSDLFVSVDIGVQALRSGDILMTCSDGLHGALREAQIARILTRPVELETKASALVELANELDGSDNISLQLIEVSGIARMGVYRGRPYRIP